MLDLIWTTLSIAHSLDDIRGSLWRYGRACELNGYNAHALWLFAWAAWLPW